MGEISLSLKAKVRDQVSKILEADRVREIAPTG